MHFESLLSQRLTLLFFFSLSLGIFLYFSIRFVFVSMIVVLRVKPAMSLFLLCRLLNRTRGRKDDLSGEKVSLLFFFFFDLKKKKQTTKTPTQIGS